MDAPQRERPDAMKRGRADTSDRELSAATAKRSKRVSSKSIERPTAVTQRSVMSKSTAAASDDSGARTEILTAKA